MKKLLNVLNLKLDSNQVWIVGSLLVSGFLATYISPTIVKEIYSQLPAEWIAFEALFGSAAGLVISLLWRNAIRREAIKHFLALVIAETVCGVALCAWLVLINYNVWVLAIASLLYTSFITIFVGKCIMAFKSKLWNNEQRESYDNNIQIISGTVAILGFAMALFFLPSLTTALILWGVAYLVDDIGWAVVYWKNQNDLNVIEEDKKEEEN